MNGFFSLSVPFSEKISPIGISLHTSTRAWLPQKTHPETPLPTKIVCRKLSSERHIPPPRKYYFFGFLADMFSGKAPKESALRSTGWSRNVPRPPMVLQTSGGKLIGTVDAWVAHGFNAETKFTCSPDPHPHDGLVAEALLANHQENLQLPKPPGDTDHKHLNNKAPDLSVFSINPSFSSLR